jgi:hypothetical protein
VNSETMNVQKAARTLLELYALLRNEQSREDEFRTREGERVNRI